ncbi:chemotaxis protein CheW [Psychromonas ossibalaenae]|uniref:chemotaxis protein CheW n=1 Tax=Psychromonas ossibalaenae TaxID=444922 RepID=UPI0003608D83|nr:chemotaxis protein CheW [Psychromonas ossibalaenae]
MSIDMKQFYAVFFEEVSEHLANMESLLLAIDIESPSLDDLNAVFRAAHSIKGGAGIFAFDDMTEVTHILETLLDKLRKQETVLTSEMIDAFLQAGDLLAEMKEAHQEDGEVDSAKVKALCKSLESLSAESGASSQSAESNAVPEIVDRQITFLTGEKEDIACLLRELAEFGELSYSSEMQDDSKKWSVTLTKASVSDDELTDCITFFTEPGSIIITRLEAKEETAFGLFTEESAHALIENDSFGFFDELPVKNSGAESETLPVPHLSSVSEAATADDPSKETEAYGFFSDETKKTEIKPLPETSLKKAPKSTQSSSESSSSIRVNTEKVDQLINQVGELVITQAMLTQISALLDPSEHEILLNRLTQLERNTRDLQESVMSIRMMPISFVFARFPRVVRDLSGKLHKKINLKMIGDETELDKGLVEKLADPLTHLIRNSIDHGIEMPEKRLAEGKEEAGTISLFAFYQGGNVVINVSDDGAGLNREKILAKAVERGLNVSDSMTDNEVFQLIFSAGFSTAEKVTDVSGRGVGMDVVKRNIIEMGGQVEIHSDLGLGSTISIRLPLTLAILDGMSIAVGDHIYIIPLTFISESLQPQPENIKTINGKGTVVKVRGEYISLLALHQLFNIETQVHQPSDGILVLLESNNKKTALLVDRLVGQQQVVLKSLETNFHAVPYISGATIMGDGRVALILDAVGLISAME